MPTWMMLRWGSTMERVAAGLRKCDTEPSLDRTPRRTRVDRNRH
jgi:hypothetical protein